MVFLRNRKFLIGIIFFLTLAATAVTGNLFVQPEQRCTGSFPPNLPPGQQGGVLGTDSLGRSMAIQMSEAVPKSMEVGLIAALLGTLLGAFVGFSSGYFGGLIDAVLRVLIDVFLSIPSLLFLILIASLLRGVSVPIIAIIISLFAWPPPARQVRAQTLSLRERAFVKVAHLSGMSGLEIIFLELMPNMLQWLGANFINAFIAAILAEAGLSVMGLGPHTEMTLGMMVYWALNYGALLRNLWWFWLPPVLTLTFLFLSLYLVHLGFDEVINPRLRSRV